MKKKDRIQKKGNLMKGVMTAFIINDSNKGLLTAKGYQQYRV